MRDPSSSAVSRGGVSPIGAAYGYRGIPWILAAVVLFASLNATAKHLTLSYPLMQVVWARYTFHLAFLVIMLGPRVRAVMATGRLWLQLVRSGLLMVTTILFFFGLIRIPLADASAIMYTAPLLVTVLSMPLLGERVGPRRWAGVVIGFAGALIIIRPGAGIMQSAALMLLGAACFHALYQITTRKLGHTDRPITTLFYTPLVGTLLASAMMPFLWVSPDPFSWLLMAILGLFGGAGHFMLIKAFQASQAATITPFTYTNLLWATVYGYFLFGNLPDIWTVFGAVVIIASSLYIFYREQRRDKAKFGEPSGTVTE